MSPSAPRTYRWRQWPQQDAVSHRQFRPTQPQAGRQKRGYSNKRAKEKDIQSGARASRMPSAHCVASLKMILQL